MYKIVKMKYIIILFISLGLVLSEAIGFEYNCSGNEMFPKYYGSPFMFKKTSLGTSIEYFYSVYGLLANVLVWSIFVIFVRYITLKLLQRVDDVKWIKLLKDLNKIIVGIFIVFSTSNIFFTYWTLGSGFNRDMNYWYFDFDNQVKAWCMTCEVHFIMNFPSY